MPHLKKIFFAKKTTKTIKKNKSGDRIIYPLQRGDYFIFSKLSLKLNKADMMCL